MNVKGIEQGTTNVLIALSVINALLEEGDDEISSSWSWLPTIAIIGGNFRFFAHCFRC